MIDAASIFNDVLGPVMRGPSSSHCAAAHRIGMLCRDLMDGQIEDLLIQYDRRGSLATTHESHGSDMGLFAGILGMDIEDLEMVRSPEALQAAGISVRICMEDLGDIHPNTYRLELANRAEAHSVVALSTGGGMIEVTQVDGIEVSIRGDRYETLVFTRQGEERVTTCLTAACPDSEITVHKGKERTLVQARGRAFPRREVLEVLLKMQEVRGVKMLRPILPVLFPPDSRLPFRSAEDMLHYNRAKRLSMWQLAVEYESARSGLAVAEVFQSMRRIARVMRQSVDEGLRGTDYAERILGRQAERFEAQMGEGRLLDGGMLNRMILYATAVMETKSAMGLIVAAPTAGSCGVLPGACLGAADALGIHVEGIVKALLAAGLIGLLICERSTFSAEIAGCQAECGAASGMAAAALATLAGGGTEQGIAAASMALQNILGLVCDPVANRVEVPCLGKNILAVANALACANMALAGYDPVIPLDETLEAMDAVGRSLPSELRCTALGGLSITRTSKMLERRLQERKEEKT